MIRFMLPLLAAVSISPLAAAERRYTIVDFDRVQIEGPFEVTLATGRPSSARALGSNAAIERVALDVQGRTLRIRANRSAWGGYPGEGSGPVKIEISAHSVRAASLAGSGSLLIDKARSMRFDLALAGAGRIGIGGIETDMLTISQLGSGKVSIAGKAKSLRATIQGSGDLDGQGLIAEDAQIHANTAGAVGISARRAASVTSSGQGDVTVVGSPACTVKQLGSGRIFCGSSDQR